MSDPKKHGVVAVLQDDTGRYLLIRRGLTLKRAPGWWCFVGGEVEPGESFEDAIVREVREEVGLSVRALDKIHETISPNGEYRLHWFRVQLAGRIEDLVPHSVEVEEVRWVSPAEAISACDPMLPALKAWLQGLS
ncbi:MAG TPA: NUDIX hydrolase [Planctomycetota bacterium]|nr:NUDIX hydrolase [Planctomycetota bacterium]